MSDEDLELLVKIAAREQRYKCVDNARELQRIGVIVRESDMQNTLFREEDVLRVLELWRNEVARNVMTTVEPGTAPDRSPLRAGGG